MLWQLSVKNYGYIYLGGIMTSLWHIDILMKPY